MKKRKLSLPRLLLGTGGLVALLVLLITAVNLIGAPTVTEEPPRQTAAEKTPLPTQISLLAVGDNLIHNAIYQQALARGGNTYDFSYAYKEIIPYLQEFDFRLINQETPLGGKELGLSSYPQFNSPTELGAQLTEMGFNLVSHANNHVLDAGEEGLLNTLNFWQTQPQVTVAGAFPNAEAAAQIPIVEKDGVKIAFLAYTYGTNGLSLPAESPAVVELIDEEQMKTQLAQAESLADITLVMMHWGIEYEPKANAEQKALAQLLAASDVEIIIGAHPHVIQEVETLVQPDGGKCICFYSLGNFISAQDQPETMLGGMAGIRLQYDRTTRETSFTKVEFIPIVTHYDSGFRNIHLVPLARYTEELAAAHGLDTVSIPYFQDLLQQRIDAKYLNIR